MARSIALVLCTLAAVSSGLLWIDSYRARRSEFISQERAWIDGVAQRLFDQRRALPPWVENLRGGDWSRSVRDGSILGDRTNIWFRTRDGQASLGAEGYIARRPGPYARPQLFGWDRLCYRYNVPPGFTCGTGRSTEAMRWHSSRQWYSHEISAPIGLIFAVFAAWPVHRMLFGRLLRRRYRRKHGLCRQCGYDLTGNVSGVCSECGVQT